MESATTVTARRTRVRCHQTRTRCQNGSFRTGVNAAPHRRSLRPNVVGSGTGIQPNRRRTWRLRIHFRSSNHPPP